MIFFYCDQVTISLELLLIIIDSVCRDSVDTQYVTIQKLEHGKLIYAQYTNHLHIFCIFMEKDSYRECLYTLCHSDIPVLLLH